MTPSIFILHVSSMLLAVLLFPFVSNAFQISTLSSSTSTLASLSTRQQSTKLNISNLFNNDNDKTPQLPRDVKEAVSKCREAVQKGLENRLSRMVRTFLWKWNTLGWWNMMWVRLGCVFVFVFEYRCSWYTSGAGTCLSRYQYWCSNVFQYMDIKHSLIFHLPIIFFFKTVMFQSLNIYIYFLTCFLLWSGLDFTIMLFAIISFKIINDKTK